MPIDNSSTILLTPTLINELKLHWSDRKGDHVKSPYHVPVIKLENARVEAARNEAGKEILANLLILLNQNIEKIDLKLCSKKGFSTSGYESSPFFNRQNFASALYTLKNNLAVAEYEEAQVLIAFYAYKLVAVA